MTFGLKNDVLQKIIDVFKLFSQIDEVILFGSRAKGSERNGSDIDFAIKGDLLTRNDIHALSLAIDNLYLPYKFDLIIFSEIEEQDLIDHINRVGKIIYKK